MPNGLSQFADVAVPVAVRGTFMYAIPPHLRDDVRLGSRVEVPLGAKRTTGFVVNLVDNAPADAKLKPIHSVLDEDEPALLPEIIDLCRWAAEYYIAPLGEMLRVALPANMAARGRREVVWSGAQSDEPLIEELKKRPLLLKDALEAFPRSTIQRLRDAGVIAIRDRLRDAVGVRFDRFAVLIDDGDATPKQRAAIFSIASRVRLIIGACLNSTRRSTPARSRRRSSRAS